MKTYIVNIKLVVNCFQNSIFAISVTTQKQTEGTAI